MSWAELLQKEVADCLCIAGHCWVSGRFSSVMQESGSSRGIIENRSKVTAIYFAWKKPWTVLSMFPFSPNHCIVMEKHSFFAFLSLTFPVRVHKENFTESCGCGLALVMTQGLPLQCGVLHLCTSDLSGITFTAVEEQCGDSCLLVLTPFCSGVFFYIWYLMPFLHLVSSHIPVIRDKTVFLSWKLLSWVRVFFE